MYVIARQPAIGGDGGGGGGSMRRCGGEQVERAGLNAVTRTRRDKVEVEVWGENRSSTYLRYGQQAVDSCHAGGCTGCRRPAVGRWHLTVPCKCSFVHLQPASLSFNPRVVRAVQHIRLHIQADVCASIKRTILAVCFGHLLLARTGQCRHDPNHCPTLELTLMLGLQLACH